MELSDAVKALGALAQETRLSLFRHLVAAGPDGLAAGVLGEAFGIPGATLSFHLKALEQGGLVQARRAGRQIFYAVKLDGVRSLMDFLTRDCCGGRPDLCGLALEAVESQDGVTCKAC